MYPTILDCDSKCLAFLIHSTYNCAQRPAFISVLAQLCFLFPSVESIKNDEAFILELIASVDDDKFLSVLQRRFGNSNHVRSDVIKSAFSDVEKMATTWKVRITSANEKRLYRVVVASTFYEHLKFAGQKGLLLEVFGQKISTKNDNRTNQDTNNSSSVTGTKQKRYTDAMPRTNQYMTLKSQLTGFSEHNTYAVPKTASIQAKVCFFLFFWYFF